MRSCKVGPGGARLGLKAALVLRFFFELPTGGAGGSIRGDLNSPIIPQGIPEKNIYEQSAFNSLGKK